METDNGMSIFFRFKSSMVKDRDIHICGSIFHFYAFNANNSRTLVYVTSNKSIEQSLEGDVADPWRA